MCLQSCAMKCTEKGGEHTQPKYNVRNVKGSSHAASMMVCSTWHVDLVNIAVNNYVEYHFLLYTVYFMTASTPICVL